MPELDFSRDVPDCYDRFNGGVALTSVQWPEGTDLIDKILGPRREIFSSTFEAAHYDIVRSIQEADARESLHLDAGRLIVFPVVEGFDG